MPYIRLINKGILILIFFATIIRDNKIKANSTEPNNTLNSEEVPFEHGNTHICKEGRQMPWCIPEDFNPEVEPWKLVSNLPWKYQFTFDILDIQEVDDRKQTITIMMYLRIKWFEPRLVIEENNTDWTQPGVGLSNSPDLLKYMWNPDLEIYGIEKFGSKTILKEMADIQIFKDKHVNYNARVDTTISCQMNFDSYPMDTHHCPFRISSYYGTDNMVTCISVYNYFKERQRSLQYSIKIEPLPSKYRKFYTRINHVFDTCGFSILFIRNRTQIVFQVYLTSAMFVIVSWVSFIINPDVVPGRIGLLVTIFLVLVNIFNGVKSDAPVSTHLNAVDLYLVVCIGQVFLALAEYALVLFLNKHTISFKSSTIATMKEMKFKKGLKKSQESSKKETKKLDKMSLVIFPFCFILFNLIYLGLYM